MENNKLLEILKPNPVIEMTGQLSLLQHKAFNVMLVNGKEKIQQGGYHEMDFKSLMDEVGYNSKDEIVIKKALDALISIAVFWKIFDSKGKKELNAATLLTHLIVKDGVLRYKFNDALTDFFLEAYSYTILNLLIQTRFESKYALVIWELCQRYQKVGSTGWKELRTFKEFLGIEKKYSEFKDLNKWIFKPAIKEINGKSDLYIKVDFKKHLRKVTHLRFLILKNSAFNPEQPDKPKPLTEAQKEKNKAKFAELKTLLS